MLMAGQSVTRKAYDFTQHRRTESSEIIKPADVLIVEGIHAFFDERLTKMMFLKLYINVRAGYLPAAPHQARYPRPRPPD